MFATVTILTALVATACGTSPQSPATANETTVATATTSVSIPTSAEGDPAEPCGSEQPVFPANFDSADRRNADGALGAGPQSIPPTEGQLVTHWFGQYSNYELRWPPTEAVETGQADELDLTATVAGLPATEPVIVDGRGTIIIQLDADNSRCSLVAVEVYGPRDDPLFDEIYAFSQSLRPRGELAAYLALVDDETVQASGGMGRESGACGQPLPIAGVELDRRGRVPHELAVELVERFVADRLDGLRAQDCLTASALDRYGLPDAAGQELCLFSCANGARVVGPQPPVVEPFGQSTTGTLVLVVVELDGGRPKYREQIEVIVGEEPDGTAVALVADAVWFPDSYVDTARAALLVDDFLTELASGDFEAAAGALVNEGYSQAVEEALGDVYTGDVPTLLERYCASALCQTEFSIIETGSTGLFSAEVLVRFDRPGGPVESALTVMSFEGVLSIGSLPPTSD